MQDNYAIDTPENVTFNYEVAGIGSRFVAALVDHLVIGMGWLVLALAVTALLTSGDGLDQGAQYYGTAVFSILFLMLCAYYSLFEILLSGQTPGKMLVGIRVVHADGTPITVADALLRNVVRLVDFLPLAYGLGFVVMFANKESRRLGDFAAGTVVVKERRDVTLETLGSGPGAALQQVTRVYGTVTPAPGETDGWPIEALTPDDVELLSDFLRRRQQLRNSGDVARNIARALATRMSLAQTDFTPAGAEAFLQDLAAQYQRRMQASTPNNQ